MTATPIAISEKTIARSRAKCIACDGRAMVEPHSGRYPWLRCCTECFIQFADPQPSDEELADIYRADYYATFGCRDRASDAYHQLMRCRADRLLALVEQAIPIGRLLDVGSGLGNLLTVGRERGWDVRGVEPNAYAVDSAEQRLPGVMFCGGIEEYNSEPGSFDLISCLDVIEHLRRPDDVLEQFHDWLGPGGGLVISTVDMGSLAARLMGSRWPHYHRDHLWYFNRKSLTALVERAGFAILDCCRVRKAFTLHYLLSILSQPQQAALIRRTAAVALRLTPGWIARRLFSLREGLFVMARRA